MIFQKKELMEKNSNEELIKSQAKELVEKHGKKAVEVANRKVENLNNQHSRESDFNFQVLSEVEKLVEDLD